MRRTLLHEQLPRDLKVALSAVGAVSVHDLGWSGLKNGELLRRAAADGFTTFVTMDRNLRFQQKLESSSLGVVLVRARSNRVEDLLPLVPALMGAIETVSAGSFLEVNG